MAAVTDLLEVRGAAFDRGAGLTTPRNTARWPGPLDVLCTLDPRTVRTPALELIDAEMRWVEATPDARLIVVLAPQEGKGLALGTPIATPSGWTTMGDLAAGSTIIGGDGRPCTVVEAFPVRRLDCYRVTFQDGSTLVADGDHRWKVWDRSGYDPAARASGGSGQRCWRVVDTRELARDPGRYAVPGQPALDLPDREDLLLPPYVLGAWLGDGTTSGAGFTSADVEMAKHLDAEGWPVRRMENQGPYAWTWATNRLGGWRSDPDDLTRFVQRLRRLGVLGAKHIPDQYLRGSYAQRLALLQGLMDTDGSCYGNGTGYTACEFTSTNERLADDVLTLVRSLGIRCYRQVRRAMLNGRDCGPVWKIKFTTDVPVFRLTRKLDRLYDVPGPRKIRQRIGVKAVEMVESIPTRCIRVDSPDSTFLAGRDLIPTHNSSTVTRAGTVWFLERHPDWRVVIASYADRIARRFGRRVRNDITANQGARGRAEFGLRLAPDQKAASEWELTTGGGVWATGVGGALTSVSAELLIIDDPLKGRKTADSEIVREDVREWWKSTAASRLSPGARVILVLTRWHHDDLAGWLLEDQPDQWRVIHVPAQADPEIIDPDPLGRAPGEFMVSARGRTQAQWEQRKRDAGDEWEQLYQGNPQAPGGNRFLVDKIRYWHPSADGKGIVCGTNTWPIDDCYRFVTMDTATTKNTSSDYTVASAWAITLDNQLILLDVARARTTEDEQLELARPLVERWRPECTWIEPSLRSTLLVRQAIKEGWTLDDLKADTNKLVRAAPATRIVKQGRAWFPHEHPELAVIVKELRQFPNGRHDDFVDTFAYAELVHHQEYVIAGVDVLPREPVPVDPYLAAVDAPAVDYDTVQW